MGEAVAQEPPVDAQPDSPVEECSLREDRMLEDMLAIVGRDALDMIEASKHTLE